MDEITSESISKRTNNGKGKAKGNRYEIKIAKLISEWIFDTPNILWKDSTSGGRKIIYKGDIVPAKAHEFPWKVWPFLFEVKNGYKNHIPTLMNFNKVKDWLSKLISELDEYQFVPILIAQFHCQIPILITNQVLNFYTDISLMIENPYNKTYEPFYIYNFNNIIKEPFHEIIPSNLKDFILANMEKRERTIIHGQKNDNLYQGLGNILGDIIV